VKNNFRYGVLIVTAVIGLWYRLNLPELVIIVYGGYSILFIQAPLGRNRRGIFSALLNIESKTPALIALALLFLAAPPLIFGMVAMSEKISAYAYYLFAIAIILRIMETKLGIDRESFFIPFAQEVFHSLYARAVRSLEAFHNFIRRIFTRNRIRGTLIVVIIFGLLHLAGYDNMLLHRIKTTRNWIVEMIGHRVQGVHEWVNEMRDDTFLRAEKKAHDPAYRSQIRLLNYRPTDILTLGEDALPLKLNITNTGKITWDPSGQNPVDLGIIWIKKSDIESIKGRSWNRIYSKILEKDVCALPGIVKPGSIVRTRCELGCNLPPGEYQVWIGPVVENVTWFYEKGDIMLKLNVRVKENR